MDSPEAYNLIDQLKQDLSLEPDPEVRAWYRVESELQPEIVEARKVVLRDLAGLIGLAIEKRSDEVSAKNLSENAEGLDPNEIPETPHLPTAGEVLWSRIDRKYNRLYTQYQQELKTASSLKKSKREFKEKIARRQFARQFNDFNDLTGDVNIALQAELMGAIVRETIFDEDLKQAVFDHAAEYAQKNPHDVINDPKNFAYLLAASVVGRPHAEQFEGVLKGLFAAKPDDMPEIPVKLAHSALWLLEDFEALQFLMGIVYLKKDYVPVALHSERMKLDAINSNQGDFHSLSETNQANSIFKAISDDITGLRYSLDQKPGVAQQLHAAVSGVMVDGSLRSDGQEFADIPEGGTDYDPVEVIDVSGLKQIDLGVKPMTDSIRQRLEASELFRMRMEKLSPYSYAVRAAKNLLQSQRVHGLSMPLSPKIAVEIYFPGATNGPPTQAELESVSERFGELHNEVLTRAVDAEKMGVSSYQDDGHLRMVYQSLFDGDVRKGIILYRPAIPTDKYTHTPLQQLSINYACIRGNELLKGNNLEGFEETELEQENEKLRIAIRQNQKRFLGRRPIKFAMPAELRQMAGLVNVSLRYNPREHDIICNVNLDDGDVELSLDRDLHFTDSGKLSLAYPGIRQYYENLILKLVKHWACANEVHTSEGEVSESSGHSANMGHFAYLRVRDDGRKYKFSENQRELCLEEQGLDLANESERLKTLDQSGKERNSTYVREYFDPSKPPLVVYATLDGIV